MRIPVLRPVRVTLFTAAISLNVLSSSFAADVENEELCKQTLSNTELDAMRVAIEDLYYFEFVLGEWQFMWCCSFRRICSIPDEIPVRGFVGHLEEGGFLPHNHKVYLWAHLHFNIEYNGDQVSCFVFA